MSFSEQYFIGSSEPMKLDSKNRVVIPRRIQVNDLPERLVLIKGSVANVAVVGLFAAIPQLRHTSAEAVHALWAFSRVVTPDTQGRLGLSEGEAKHLDARANESELIVVGRGLSAVIANNLQADELYTYYSTVLRGEGQAPVANIADGIEPYGVPLTALEAGLGDNPNPVQ